MTPLAMMMSNNCWVSYLIMLLVWNSILVTWFLAACYLASLMLFGDKSKARKLA